MKSFRLGLPLLALVTAAAPATAADDPRITNFALCQESWLELQESDPAALQDFGAFLGTAFSRTNDEGYLTPNAPITVDGLDIARIYPDTFGMGVGFSVLVSAPFDVVKQAAERALGLSLDECQAGDGMRTCELPIADKRTVLLLSEDPPNDQTTLVGCYYYYEK